MKSSGYFIFLALLIALSNIVVCTCTNQNKPKNLTETNTGLQPDSVMYIITTPPCSLQLDPFYKQYVNVNGIAIVCSRKVPKIAVYKACNIVNYMTNCLPQVVLSEMSRRQARLGIMARYEGTTDIPEHRFLAADTALNWDVRARGLGGDTILPLTTCAEENLLCLLSDKYHAEDITIHEFAHAIHIIGIEPVDTTINTRLQNALNAALAQGKWLNTYAGSNIYEYWAEGVQSWFNVNAFVPAADGTHSPINTRDKLKNYDPGLYNIISQYFPETTDIISCHSVPFD